VTGYEGYKPLSPEAATSLAPDILLVTTQGLEQSGGEAALLAAPGVSLTPAAKNGHVIAMDALLLLGFGPRTAEAALELNSRLNNQ
jgi:iron complex transport system substrate-binding protein